MTLHLRLLLLLYSILSLSASSIYANSTLDSLQLVLNETTSDIDRYKLLDEFIAEHEKVDRAGTIPYIFQKLELAKSLNDLEKIAETNRTLGYNYLLLNNNDSSQYFLELAMPYFEQSGDTVRITKILNNYALISQRTNDYEKAIETYHKVISMCQAVNEYQVELSTLVNVASLLINQEKEDQAISYLNRALARYKQIPTGQDSIIKEINKNILPGIYINSGICYDKVNKQDSALIVYEQALNAIEYNDNAYYASYLKSYVHNNMAYIYRDYGQWEKAKTNHQTALDLAEQIENPQGILQAKTGLGGILIKLREYPAAKTLLLESLAEAKETENLERQVDATKFFAEYFDSIQDFRSSIQYLKAHDKLNENLLNDKRDKITQDRETFYKTKEKEDQLIIQTLELKQEQEQQERQQILFLVSIIGILGFGYLLYSRYKLRKERQSAEFEKNLNIAMSRFVPTEFIKSLGRDQITEVELGDQIEKEITVIFTDIRNFTSRSEKMTATETFQFVKNYAEEMGPIIQTNGGFINQYLGDGVMAVFQNSPEDALIACIEMHERLKTYNVELESQGVEPIEVGMGLHTGPAVMGIIGDEKRRDAAMISDTINTAARMESKTKQYGVKILISEESRLRLKNPELYKLRHIGDVSVKGKEKPIDIYECYNPDNDKIFKAKENSILDFNKAVDAYYAKEFDIAKKLFYNIQSQNPYDKVCESFISEIENNFQNFDPDTLIYKVLASR